VRLGHSGLFTTGRAEMWRNAAVFRARAAGKCGLFLHEFADARGGRDEGFPRRVHALVVDSVTSFAEGGSIIGPS
jgi:hypothetical protein